MIILFTLNQVENGPAAKKTKFDWDATIQAVLSKVNYYRERGDNRLFITQVTKVL